MANLLKTGLWVVLLAALAWAGAMGAEPGEKAAADFLAWVGHRPPSSGSLSSGQRESLLREYLDDPKSPLSSSEFSYAEYLALRAYLNNKHGFQLGASLGAVDFEYRKLVAQKRPKQFAYPLADSNGAPEIWIRQKAQFQHYYYIDVDGDLIRSATPLKKNGEELIFSLNQRGTNNLDLALELIASTPRGRQLVARFINAVHFGRVGLGYLTPEVRRAYKVPDNWGGFCMYLAGGKNVIFVDPGGPLGELTVELYHEMFHALTPAHRERFRTQFDREKSYRLKSLEIRTAYQGRMGLATEVAEEGLGEKEAGVLKELRERDALETEKNTFLNEREAYSEQERFVTELIQVHPGAAPFFQYLNDNDIHKFHMSDTDLVKGYRLYRLIPSLRRRSELPQPCSALPDVGSLR